jgi:Protein of unknown function (DUF2845)
LAASVRRTLASERPRYALTRKSAARRKRSSSFSLRRCQWRFIAFRAAPPVRVEYPSAVVDIQVRVREECRMKTVLPLLLATLFATSSAPVAAQTRSFRCNNDLVNVGDAKSSVQLKCGQPVLKDSFCKPGDARPMPRVSGGAKVVINNACETVDEWTYNPGYGQFMTTLRFESGRLVSISYGDRVK